MGVKDGYASRASVLERVLPLGLAGPITPALVASILAAVGLLLALAPRGAWGEQRPVVYKWTDANGIEHYAFDADATPGSLRAALRPVDPELAAIPPPGIRPGAADPRLPDVSLPAIPGPRPLPGPRRIPPPRRWPEDPDARLSLPPARAPLTEAAPVSAAPLAASAAPPAGELRELEAQIERDRETLKTLISRADRDGGELSRDPELRALLERLPRLQARLDELRSSD